jgi:hypothetical protein
LEEKEKGRGNASNKSIPLRTLAQEYHIGQPTITQARNLLNHAPDLAQAVKDGTKSMLAAYETYEEHQREAKQQARTAERVQRYADAIAGGEMTTGQKPLPW